MSRTLKISLTLVVAAAVAASSAQAAKPKLYSVSLSGDVRTEASRVRADAVYAPEGCQGTLSETHRVAASTGLAPKPRPAPLASYGRLKFRTAPDLPEHLGHDRDLGQLHGRSQLPARRSERLLG